MTNQQQSINIINAVYAAYVNLVVSPFSNTKHIDVPSEEVTRMRRLMEVLIDSAKIESAESAFVTDFMDMYLAKKLACATSNILKFRFNGIKETFIPASSVCKEYLSPAIFRHPVQFRIDGVKRDGASWAKVISRLSMRSVIRRPKHEEGEYSILRFRGGIDIDGNIDIR